MLSIHASFISIKKITFSLEAGPAKRRQAASAARARSH
jgi:hypothetical protein